MPGMSLGLIRSTIAWRSVRERLEAADRRGRIFSYPERANHAAMGASMSAEIFALILAAIVAAVLLWVFWIKGKSD